MKFYGQRGEDRVLRKHLGDGDPGFYVDVGAWDPEIDSVTKHFYDRGWHGINIEPVPAYHERLVRARPRDVNLDVAVGTKEGRVSFWSVGDSGLSTVVDAYAEAGARIGKPTSKITVVMTTLERIFSRFVPPDARIDFLKIDVEGYEREVILGNDWNRFRPHLLCIEATVPMTSIPSWDAWEAFVLAQGYAYVESDGLNRFYRAEDA